MAPLARALEDGFQTVEPLQRLRGETPLSVGIHLDDLDRVLDEEAGGRPAALVGSSWGAMLAVCYAAREPARVSRLVLIGCGTFDVRARAKVRATRRARMSPGLRRRARELEARIERSEPAEQNRCFEALGELLFPVDCYDPVTDDPEITAYDYPGHVEAWRDMLRLQEEGTYPALFRRIEAPVLMLHGDHDPHPGADIHAGLAPLIPDLELRLFERCGHYPWIEREARDDFLGALRKALQP